MSMPPFLIKRTVNIKFLDMSEYTTSFQALGGLGALCGLMALRMSMFRLAGGPG